MSTALVLGAGGLTGQAFHLGVLTTLNDLAGFDGRTADVVEIVVTAAATVRARLEARPELLEQLRQR